MCNQKTNTTTQQSGPPPQVMQNYQELVDRARGVADTPYTPYGGQLTANLNPTQTGAIGGIANSTGIASPWFNAAGDTAGAGIGAYGGGLGALGNASGALNTAGGFGGAAGNQLNWSNDYIRNLSNMYAMPHDITPESIQQWQNPFQNQVIDATMRNVNLQDRQAQNALRGSAILGGNAFGGDRAGVAAAELERNQGMNRNATLAGLNSQNYQQALATAQQQQGLNLSARQFNLNRGDQLAALGLQGGQGLSALAGLYTGIGNANTGVAQGYSGIGAGLGNAATGLGNLGAGAQNTAMSGYGALLGAGSLGQQTEQNALNAAYQQFLQQQGYPFQTTGWLGNMILGAGSQSGGTGSTTSPGPSVFSQLLGAGATAAGLGMAFSDERMKENITPVGKTFDGQTIYRYNFKGSPKTEIGLIAQDVEKHHPEAVHSMRGLKMLDYADATDDAAERGHMAAGGAPYGGSGVPYSGGLSGIGGSFVPDVMQELVNRRGLGPPKPPTPPAQEDPGKQGLQALMGIARGQRRAGAAPGAPTDITPPGAGFGMTGMGGTMDMGMAPAMGGLGAIYSHGGAVGYADGGMPEIDASDIVIPEISRQAMDDWRRSTDFARGHQDTGDISGLSADPELGPMLGTSPGMAPSSPAGDLPPEFARLNRTPPAGPEMAYDAPAGGLGGLRGAPPPGYGQPPQADRERTGLDSPWMGLAMAGLGMMASRSPHVGPAIGEGGMQGLSYVTKQREAQRKMDAEHTIDHSGPTIRVYYPGTKQWVDTGIPTQTAGQKASRELEERRLTETEKQHRATTGLTEKQRELEERKIAETERHNREVIEETRRARSTAEERATWEREKPVSVSPGTTLVRPSTGEVVARNTESSLTPEAVDDIAARYIAGDKSAIQNIGRGAQGSADLRTIQNRISSLAREQGMTPQQVGTAMASFAGQTAAMRTLGTKGANIEYAANTADKAIDIARETIAKLPRTSYLPINKLIQGYQTQTLSPEQASAYAATNTLVNEYARVVSPTGVPTEGTRNHAREMLNTAMDQKSFNAVLDMMKREIKSAKDAFTQTRKEFLEHGQPGEKKPEPTATGAPAPAPNRVKQNGHTYERQPDGSYKAID